MLTSSGRSKICSRYKLSNAYVVKPSIPRFIDAVRQLGAFWAVINEPPPGGIPRG